MKYVLLVKDKVRSESEFVIDLCHIIEAYCGESCFDLETEYFENGYLERGYFWVIESRMLIKF